MGLWETEGLGEAVPCREVEGVGEECGEGLLVSVILRVSVGRAVGDSVPE